MYVHLFHSLTLAAVLRIVGVASLLVFLDQTTKAVSQWFLAPGDPLSLTSFLNLTLNYNPGISFGLFSGASSYALVALTGVVIAVVFIWAFSADTWQEQFSLSLIAGGGTSNVIDRAVRGSITDFIDFHLESLHWPTFNVADIGITAGVIGLLLIVLSGAPAKATEVKTGLITIVQPWSRATPSGAKNGAGYLKITNLGSESERLKGGMVDAAKIVQIHRLEIVDGIARMRQLTDGLTIAPGETVEFKPGSLHLMFVDLIGPLKEGDRIRGTLEFEKAGNVAVEYFVEKLGSLPTHAGH